MAAILTLVLEGRNIAEKAISSGGTVPAKVSIPLAEPE
jgi:hypothetical protein